MKKTPKTRKKNTSRPSKDIMQQDPMDEMNIRTKYLAEDAAKMHPTVQKIQKDLHGKLKEAIRQTLAGQKVVD